jgi:hypothetical protein
MAQVAYARASARTRTRQAEALSSALGLVNARALRAFVAPQARAHEIALRVPLRAVAAAVVAYELAFVHGAVGERVDAVAFLGAAIGAAAAMLAGVELAVRPRHQAVAMALRGAVLDIAFAEIGVAARAGEVDRARRAALSASRRRERARLRIARLLHGGLHRRIELAQIVARLRRRRRRPHRHGNGERSPD